MKKPLRFRTNVPIYDADLRLIVSDSIIAERIKLEPVFGRTPSLEFTALCSYDAYGHFALFFKPDRLTHGVVGHELFHLTHRIMEWSGAKFTPDNPEVFAHLQGFLNKWINKKLKGRIK